MPHINLPKNLPGIRSLVTFRSDTGQHLYALAEALLRNPSPLIPAERELIATHVSALNQCNFCRESHAAAARELFGDKRDVVDEVIKTGSSELLSPKMQALLVIAGKVQKSGKSVTEKDVEIARNHGAGDRDIHDTVLIAAAFCMFNRYVDGLDTLTPTDPASYREMGKRMTTAGYTLPPEATRKEPE